jgi:hypothetical protein
VHDGPTCEALTVKVEQALFKCAKTPKAVLARCRLPTEWARAAEAGLLKNNFLEGYSSDQIHTQEVAGSIPTTPIR